MTGGWAVLAVPLGLGNALEALPLLAACPLAGALRASSVSGSLLDCLSNMRLSWHFEATLEDFDFNF